MRLLRVVTTIALSVALCSTLLAQDQNKEKEPVQSIVDASYAKFGVTLLIPAVLNLDAGYWFGRVGVRASGMYYGKTRGIQCNIGYKLSESTKSRHVLAMVVGTSQFPNRNFGTQKWCYYGIVYNYNRGGFFVEPGLSVGKGTFSSPQLILQIGYLHRFL